VGRNSYINERLLVEGRGKVHIGDNVRLGADVRLLTSHHDITDNPDERSSWQVTYKDVTIENGCWIGSSATILPGVTIARGCVIGAGAVVTRNTKPNGLYVGAPARRLRDLPVRATPLTGFPEPPPYPSAASSAGSA